MTEHDYGYAYDRFFSYYTLDEMRAYVERVGLSVVYSEASQSPWKGDWIQVIARKP